MTAAELDFRADVPLEHSQEFFKGLGSFWTQKFEDRAVTEVIVGALQDKFNQAQIGLKEDIAVATALPRAPLHHVEAWYRMALYEADMVPEQPGATPYQETNGAFGADGTWTFGKGLPTRWNWEVNEAIVDIPCIATAITTPEYLAYRNQGFYLDNGILGFQVNPFADPRFRVVQAPRGPVVHIWLRLSKWDRRVIARQYAVPLGLPGLPSTESYRVLCEGAWESRVKGPSNSALYKIISGASGVPLCRSEGEVVEVVTAAPNGDLVVVTDKGVYRFPGGHTCVVAPGDIMAEGQEFTSELKVRHPASMTSGQEDITVPPGLFSRSAGIQGPIRFPNARVPVTPGGLDAQGNREVSFRIFGDGRDLQRYRGAVNAAQIYKAFDTRGPNAPTMPGAAQLRATVNPAIDLIARHTKPHLILLYGNPSKWPTRPEQQALLFTQADKVVPPHGRLVFQPPTSSGSQSSMSFQSSSSSSFSNSQSTPSSRSSNSSSHSLSSRSSRSTGSTGSSATSSSSVSTQSLSTYDTVSSSTQSQSSGSTQSPSSHSTQSPSSRSSQSRSTRSTASSNSSSQSSSSRSSRSDVSTASSNSSSSTRNRNSTSSISETFSSQSTFELFSTSSASSLSTLELRSTSSRSTASSNSSSSSPSSNSSSSSRSNSSLSPSSNSSSSSSSKSISTQSSRSESTWSNTSISRSNSSGSSQSKSSGSSRSSRSDSTQSKSSDNSSSSHDSLSNEPPAPLRRTDSSSSTSALTPNGCGTPLAYQQAWVYSRDVASKIIIISGSSYLVRRVTNYSGSSINIRVRFAGSFNTIGGTGIYPFRADPATDPCPGNAFVSLSYTQSTSFLLSTKDVSQDAQMYGADVNYTLAAGASRWFVLRFGADIITQGYRDVYNVLLTKGHQHQFTWTMQSTPDFSRSSQSRSHVSSSSSQLSPGTHSESSRSPSSQSYRSLSTRSTASSLSTLAQWSTSSRSSKSSDSTRSDI